MLSSQIKSNEIVFGSCNKDLLEEIIFYGIGLGADFVEIFIENTDNSSVLAEEDFITSVSPSFGRGAGLESSKKKGWICKYKWFNKAWLDEIGISGYWDVRHNRQQKREVFNGLNKHRDYSLSKKKWINEVPSDSWDKWKTISQHKVSKKNNKIITRKGSYSRNLQEVIIASSDGTYVSDIRLHQTVGLNVIASDAQYRSSGSRRFGSQECLMNSDYGITKKQLMMCLKAQWTCCMQIMLMRDKCLLY